MIQQILDAIVTIEIYGRVRMAVSGQEILDPKRPCAMIRSDQHNVSEAVRDNLDSAEDESPHENVAEFAIRLYQSHQVFAIDIEHFSRLTCAYLHKTTPAREHGDFTGEHTRFKNGNEILGCSRGPHNLDFTGNNDE